MLNMTTPSASETIPTRVAIGRKNYLFVGSERGGAAAAVFYSCIQACKSHDINVQAYLTHVLTNLPVTPKDKSGQLLPGYYASNLVQ